MNEHVNKPDGHLTEGWPDEPGNEELAELATRLKASRPALSAQAMARVERAMRREMSTRSPLRRRPWALYACALAAAALLALGLDLYFDAIRRPPHSPPVEAVHPAPAHDQTQAAAAHDTYSVRFASLPAPRPGGPLLSLDKYESLYADLR